MAKCISDKINITTKRNTKNKEGHFIIIEGQIYQAAINIFVPNMKQKQITKERKNSQS